MYLFGTHRSIPQRLRLTSRLRLGAGNFFWHACDVAPDLDRPLLYRPDGQDVRELSLRDLRDRVESYANWYHSRGVGHGTRVGLYTGNGLTGLLHHIAITSLGGVSVIANPAMAPDLAVGYLIAAEATLLSADASRLRLLRRLWPEDNAIESVDIDTVHRSAGWADGPPPRPCRHAPDDLVMISHSSGTTGVPKPTLFTHRGFFVGKKERLWRFPSARTDRLLTALPQSHSAGISYLSIALLLGIPTMVVDDRSGAAVADAMNRFLPTVVIGFPASLADLPVDELSANARNRVHTWMGMGDASHERHIRPLVRIGGGGAGSTYVDGLGSSEMGMVLFRHAHTAASLRFDRVIGKPVPVVRKAAVVDARGNELPDGEAGLLGVRTPSVTPGYVGDAELDERSRRGGYFLTGDVVRRVDGTWYHLDRTPDVIVTEHGPVYSLPVEEVVLMETQAFDAAVIAVDDPKADGFTRPVAVVLFKDRTKTPDEVLARCNTVLTRRGMAPLAAVVVAADRESLPVGVTGKVLKRVLRERHRALLSGPPEPGVALAAATTHG